MGIKYLEWGTGTYCGVWTAECRQVWGKSQLASANMQ